MKWHPILREGGEGGEEERGRGGEGERRRGGERGREVSGERGEVTNTIEPHARGFRPYLA